jgi:hypothetical protein
VDTITLDHATRAFHPKKLTILTQIKAIYAKNNERSIEFLKWLFFHKIGENRLQ